MYKKAEERSSAFFMSLTLVKKYVIKHKYLVVDSFNKLTTNL